MNVPSPARPQTETLGFPGVSFGRSADGIAVALVGDTAFAMAPARDDRHYLVRLDACAFRWASGRAAISTGTPANSPTGGGFARACSKLPTSAWSARCSAVPRNIRVPTRRGAPRRVRRSTPRASRRTRPPGTAGQASAERNRKVHRMLRSAGGCYEEEPNGRSSRSPFRISSPPSSVAVQSGPSRTAGPSLGDDLRHDPDAGESPRDGSPGLRSGPCPSTGS